MRTKSTQYTAPRSSVMCEMTLTWLLIRRGWSHAEKFPSAMDMALPKVATS